MRHDDTWVKKAEKTSAVFVSFKRLSLSLGDYLSTIRSLKMANKDIKQTR